MKFKKLKNTWFFSNRHYLIPVILLIALVNATIALGLAIAALAIWFVNILRARLPIHSKSKLEAETLVFKTIGNSKLKLDLWRPAKGGPGKAVIVFAHGGGWISGSRSQPINVSWCEFLADRGFAVASVDYRFAYINTMADIVEDYSDSVDFIRKNAKKLRISPKIILMGLSAGGHLALCHAAFNTSSSSEAAKAAMVDVKGVVAYYAPSDLTDLFEPEEKSFFARFGASAALKTLPRFDEEIYEKYSPINSLSSKMVPVMAVHGREDEIVPYSSSVKLIKKLKELGVTCRFLVHKTGGHGFEVRLKDYRTTMILEETARFMRKIALK